MAKISKEYIIDGKKFTTTFQDEQQLNRWEEKTEGKEFKYKISQAHMHRKPILGIWLQEYANFLSIENLGSKKEKIK